MTGGEPRVREATPADTEAIRHIAEASWADDPVWSGRIPLVVEPPEGHNLLVARVDGQVTGFLDLGPSASRSHRVVTIALANQAPAEPTVAAMVRGLEAGGIGPVWTRIRPWHERIEQALVSCGFHEFERAWSAVVDPSDPAIAAWITDASGNLPADYAVEPLDGHESAAIGCLWSWYREQHPNEDHGDPPVDELRRRFLGPAIPGMARVVACGNAVVAAGSLWEDPLADSGLAHLGIAGTCLGPGNEPVVSALYAALFEAAGDVGRSVQVELSSRNVDGRAAFASMPVDLRPELVILGQPLA